MKQISLRPYNGHLFVASSRKEYEKKHKTLFKHPDMLTCSQAGRFSGGEGKDGYWTYLVWAKNPAYLAHELSHVIFHVFERCGIDPKHDTGEAFCYMLSQLMSDSMKQKKRTQKATPAT